MRKDSFKALALRLAFSITAPVNQAKLHRVTDLPFILGPGDTTHSAVSRMLSSKTLPTFQRLEVLFPKRASAISPTPPSSLPYSSPSPQIPPAPSTPSKQQPGKWWAGPGQTPRRRGWKNHGRLGHLGDGRRSAADAQCTHNGKCAELDAEYVESQPCLHQPFQAINEFRLKTTLGGSPVTRQRTALISPALFHSGSTLRLNAWTSSSTPQRQK